MKPEGKKTSPHNVEQRFLRGGGSGVTSSTRRNRKGGKRNNRWGGMFVVNGRRLGENSCCD